MSDAPPPPSSASTPASPASKVRQTMGIASMLAFGIVAGGGVFVADHFWKRVPSVRVMSAFLKAVHKGRLARAGRVAVLLAGEAEPVQAADEVERKVHDIARLAADLELRQPRLYVTREDERLADPARHFAGGTPNLEPPGDIE